MAFYKEMYGEQGFKAVHKTVHLVWFECLYYAT